MASRKASVYCAARQGARSRRTLPGPARARRKRPHSGASAETPGSPGAPSAAVDEEIHPLPMLNAGYLAAEVLLALPPLILLLRALGSWGASFFLLALAEALGHAAYYMWLAPRPASLPSAGRVRAQLAEAKEALARRGAERPEGAPEPGSGGVGPAERPEQPGSTKA